jgi:low temperature requirement protein LtrA
MARRFRGAPRAASPDAHAPVTTLELFFDLVFVFTVTQLTDLVLETHGVAGHLEPLAMLWVIWWMYDGFAWLSNNVGPTTTSTRVPMLVAMAAFLVVAIAVPDAFAGGRWPFAAGYLVIVLVHGFSFLRSSLGGSARAIMTIAPINLGMALALLAAAALPQEVRWAGWVVAAALPLVSVLRRVESGFSIRPEHFAERHRLMLIIALGESVLALGRSAQGRLTDPAHLVAVLMGMALVALLWWLHFADDGSLTLVEEITGTPEGVPGRTALTAFSFGYLVLVAGLILVAAGMREVVHTPRDPLGWSTAVTMASGAATYLVGNVFYLWRLGVTGRRWLLVMAVVSLLSVPVGHLVSGLAQLVLLVVVLLAAGRPVLLNRPRALAHAGRDG